MAVAQQSQFNFRHLGATQGLADGVVRAIGQDKYGYIWISTLSGLNRFDGYTVRTFYNDSKDSTTIPAHTVRSIFCDRKGRLWLGCNRRLVQFDYATAKFHYVPGTSELGIFKIVQHRSGLLYLHTNQGLVQFDPESLSLKLIKVNGNGEEKGFINDMYLQGDQIYLATKEGLISYHVLSHQRSMLYRPSVENKSIDLVVKDGRGHFWWTQENRSVLIQSDSTFKKVKTFSAFQHSHTGNVEGAILNLFIDQKKELWFTTNINGLVKYDYANAALRFNRSNPYINTSLSTNHVTEIFQSQRGFIWIGTEGLGVHYFHPTGNFIRNLVLPDAVAKNFDINWGRVAVADGEGLWMGFWGMVLLWKSNDPTPLYFRNAYQKKPQLYSNSVRSLLLEGDTLWIGTSKGMNRYHKKSGKIAFMTLKDSLPEGFYAKIFKDSRDNIWFALLDDIYYRDAADRKIKSLASHPVLHVYKGKGGGPIFEDHKKRIWFGLNFGGLLMYDPNTGQTKHWKRDDQNDTTIISNQIISITEDKKGIIWCSSITGLTSYDPEKEKFTWYGHENGLPSIKLGGLLVDEKNRLWIGSTKGLLMLDSSRKHVKTFDLQDGLPTMEFADMDAYKAPDGTFVYPTLKGFIAFNPEDYTPKTDKATVFLSGFKISGKDEPFKHTESLSSIRLKYDQNFFNLQLTAFNYNNPEQTWYAYQLEGFDKEWIITKDRNVTYTNVPGGNYTFRYKASSDPNNWETQEKILKVSIGTIFYKTVWFWVIMLALTAFALYVLYQNRMRQQQQIFSLQTKAQALEKEKATVMYESLKQQLNPHFLFNSLTSLSSLIRVDQKLAGKFLDGLSKMYRYILKSRDHELVSLREELFFVQHYIDLQQTRFETGFEVHVEVDETLHDRKIAPVTLQNLVENAIKHNIIDDESPLVVSICTEGDYLVVRNNLQKKKFVETSNKQGIIQLRSLYRYLTGKSIEVQDGPDHFTIKIPLI